MTPTPSNYDDEAMAAAGAFCDAILRTITIARTMLDAGQDVDVAGLDGGIGLLCAKSLDLPPAMGRAFRPRLMNVLQELDAMTLAINRQNAG